MITFPDLLTDHATLSHLDTSFTSDRIYRVEQTAHACKLVEWQVTPDGGQLELPVSDN